MEILSTRLRTLRDQKKLSQAELANSLGCRQEKISSYEIGKASPKLIFLIRMADLLDTSVDYLLGRIGTMENRILPEAALSSDEVELVDLYRELSQIQKYKLTGIAIGLKQ